MSMQLNVTEIKRLKSNIKTVRGDEKKP